MTNTIELHDAEPSKGVKSFGLKRPCSNCPFRKDLEKNRGWLGEARAAGIAKDSFFYLYDFPCHKTTSSDDEYDYWDDEDECDNVTFLDKEYPNIQDYILSKIILWRDVETDEERDYRCWLNAQYHHFEDKRTA